MFMRQQYDKKKRTEVRFFKLTNLILNIRRSYIAVATLTLDHQILCMIRLAS